MSNLFIDMIWQRFCWSSLAYWYRISRPHTDVVFMTSLFLEQAVWVWSILVEAKIQILEFTPFLQPYKFVSAEGLRYMGSDYLRFHHTKNPVWDCTVPRWYCACATSTQSKGNPRQSESAPNGLELNRSLQNAAWNSFEWKKSKHGND